MEALFDKVNGKLLLENLLKSDGNSHLILSAQGELMMMHMCDGEVNVDPLLPSNILRPIAMRCDMAYGIGSTNLEALQMFKDDTFKISYVLVLCNPKHAKVTVMYSSINKMTGKEIFKNKITYLTGQIVQS